MMKKQVAMSFILSLSLASAANAQAPTQAQSRGVNEQTANDRNQARLDQKYGPATEGRWWDELGRLCRTDHVNGKAVRRCEKPDSNRSQADEQAQQRLDKKFGRAPEGRWWDEQGRLCRTDRVGTKDVRRCEAPRPGQVSPA